MLSRIVAILFLVSATTVLAEPPAKLMPPATPPVHTETAPQPKSAENRPEAKVEAAKSEWKRIYVGTKKELKALGMEHLIVQVKVDPKTGNAQLRVISRGTGGEILGLAIANKDGQYRPLSNEFYVEGRTLDSKGQFFVGSEPVEISKADLKDFPRIVIVSAMDANQGDLLEKQGAVGEILKK